MSAAVAASTRKHPPTFGATVRTLSDIPRNSDRIDQEIRNGSHHWNNNLNVGNSCCRRIQVHVIPSLSQASAALLLLQRIHSEFKRIIEQRGWNVCSISELCCCGDGLDNITVMNPQRASSSRQRKTRAMPHNVLGYNLTMTHSYPREKSHSIHLRLRDPQTHALLPYATVAGTMCHELAHCVVAGHDAHFYKVMEDIEREYSVSLVSRAVNGEKGSDSLTKWNNSEKYWRQPSSEEKRRNATMAAMKRLKGNRLTQSMHFLGGSSSDEQKLMDPREAATVAAERRAMDSKFCLPCHQIIQIVEADSCEMDQSARKKTRFENRILEKSKSSSSAMHVIDLTTDMESPSMNQISCHFPIEPEMSKSFQDGDWECSKCTLINKASSKLCQACDAPSSLTYLSDDIVYETAIINQKSTITSANERYWTCSQCTCCNPAPFLVCGACCLER